MTPDHIAAAKKRCKEASRGPHYAAMSRAEDERLIAHAHEDLTAALDFIDILEKKISNLRTVILDELE